MVHVVKHGDDQQNTRRGFQSERPRTSIDRFASEGDTPSEAGPASGGIALLAAGQRPSRTATRPAHLIDGFRRASASAELRLVVDRSKTPFARRVGSSLRRLEPPN